MFMKAALGLRQVLVQPLLTRLLTVDLPGLMVLPKRLEINIPPAVTSVAEAAVGHDIIMQAVASAVLQVRHCTDSQSAHLQGRGSMAPLRLVHGDNFCRLACIIFDVMLGSRCPVTLTSSAVQCLCACERAACSAVLLTEQAAPAPRQSPLNL